MLTRTAIALPGYQITEQLYAGARTLVYRAVRAADQQPVVLKLLKNEHPSFSELVQFRNQYTIAKHLTFPGIIQTYGLEPYLNGYALVMEDFGGISLREYVKSKSAESSVLNGPSETELHHPTLSNLDFLTIALQVCDILHELCRYRVIHKDLKPANILIHPITKQVKLIDFSIASLLTRETQDIKNPNVLEGTLAYLSPEQTGRMNRGIDYRSDFYSLGITFYELLTGQLPFPSSDPMELVHCHLTKQPTSLHSLNPQVPLMVSEMVAKLMAKNAEDRYQSALGLKHDLEHCQNQWQEQGQITQFRLGQRDRCDRFLIPEKLYGREAEVQSLLDAFDRVSQGNIELLMVSGFSGIGKTAVINEVHKPLAKGTDHNSVRQCGYFIKGKFDQFQRNIPFSAFVQVLRDLMGQLLTESDAQLADWKAQILSAVGENGQVILEVIPELEQIIGQQPPIAELSGTAAQNRFNLLLQQFIQVFTTAEHPLVMFLDDLQWADSASLNLIKRLMTENAIGYLLILGAYRDNEVFPAHSLMLMLADIEQSKATVNTIVLSALTPIDINQLIADTLSCAIALARPLGELVYQKTQGNPFFTTQFLKALHDDRLITFDFNLGHWQCEMGQVRSLTLTDDVVKFMALQLQKLPAETQEVLKLAACVGAQFDLETLAIVSQRSPETTAAALWKALQEGLILPTSEVYKFYQTSTSPQPSALNRQNCAYKFLHDRVQQAAYSLIPDDHKQVTHLQIGQLLQQATPLNERDQKIFEMVNHLNKGLALIESESEQIELAQLNLTAGQKAKSSTAYAAALEYFNQGILLLTSDRWHRHYDLTLALYEGATESAYLNTDFEQMEQLAETVLTQARCWLDRVTTYEAKIQACVAQNQHLAAVQLAREVLEQLGVSLPAQPTQADVQQALEKTQKLLNDRPIESLLELPQMTAPEPKAAMRIISSIISAAYQVAPALLPLLSFVQVELSVQYGNAAESTYGYGQYGMMLVALLKDIDAGYRFGQLGIDLLQRIDASKLAAKTIFGFNNALRHWQEPAKNTLKGYLNACASGLETGDLEYASLSLMCHGYTAYFSGQELSALKQTMDDHRQVIRQFHQDGYLCIQSIYYQAVLNLLEPTAEPDRLCSQDYDETVMIALHLKANQGLALCQLYLNKLFLSYLFHRYEQGLENARLTEQYLGAVAGFMHVSLFSFYDALLQLAIYPTVSETEQLSILDRVTAHQEKLAQWAVHAPSNQSHRCALVAAERCRVLGQNAEASEHYDLAIARAKANDYVQEAAIANELAARFYLGWGKERIAQHYLIEAYYGYAHWGAKTKVADLEVRYPQLLAPILQQARSALSVNETIVAAGGATLTHSSSSSLSDSLDLAAILKASQALSSEIELGKLLASLLQLMVENAGADKCVLLIMQDNSQSDTQRDRLLVKGLVKVGSEPVVLQRTPVEESQDIPLNLIYSVKNRLEPMLLMDTAAHPEWVTDSYFLRQQPKSILCSPILHQGKLLGIIYLENNLTIGAFTRDRVHILNLLCAQATISIENARLYERSQAYARELEHSLKQLQTSETQLRRLFESSDDAILLLDNGAFTDCNPAAVRMMHCQTKEQFLSLHPAKLSPEMQPDGYASFEKANTMITTAFQKGTHRFEWVHRRSDGEDFWVEVVLTVMPHGDRKVLHTVWREIGDRKQAEKALQLTQFSIDHASLPAWWIKSNGQLLYANAAACRDLGYSQTEILEQYVWDLNPEFSSANWDDHRQETKNQSSLTFESVNVTKFGEIYPVEVTVNYVELDGEDYHFAFVKNIRDRKQAEQEQARLIAILEATTDIVGMADAAGNNLYINQSGQKILQIPAEEMNQFHISEVIDPSMLETMETEILPTAMREGSWSGESLLRSRSGEAIPVSQVLMTHKNAQGEVEFLSTIMRDIRDRKADELAIQQKTEALKHTLQELQQAQLQIIQSEKMSALGNLVAGVAHEINNPVGFISGNLQPALDYVKDIFGLIDLYQQEYPQPSAAIQAEIDAIDLDYVRQDLPKLIASMKLGVDRIRGISTSLRTFSRADKDHKVWFNLHEGIDSTILILKHRLKASDAHPEIEIIADYGNLPIVECFPGQLNQVFMNILANAIDTLEEANQQRTFQAIVANPNRIEIQTHLDDAEKQVIVQIRDNGMGMSDQVKQKVFDHLFTTKAVGKGTGLGLAIAHQIVVEKHGGTIEVDSVLGEGTEFVITLPIASSRC